MTPSGGESGERRSRVRRSKARWWRRLDLKRGQQSRQEGKKKREVNNVTFVYKDAGTQKRYKKVKEGTSLYVCRQCWCWRVRSMERTAK